MFKRIDSETLSRKAYDVILSLIRNGELQEKGKLPAEADLAENLGVSRSVIRDVSGILESQGYITRKRGIGTLINQEVVDTPCRLDLENDFCNMIRASGYSPAKDILSASIEKDGKGESFYQVEKLLSADELTAIYIRDRLNIPKECRVNPRNQDSILAYIETLGQSLPGITLLNLVPNIGGRLAKDKLGIKEDEPYIEMTEREFDLEQNEVINSKIIFRGGMFDLTFLRKRPFDNRSHKLNEHLVEMFLTGVA